MSVPELRPLGVGELLDVALKIWRRHFGALARIVLFVVAPLEILSSFIITSVLPEGEILFPVEGFEGSPTESPFTGTELAAFGTGVFVSFLLSGLAFLLSSAASLRAVSVAYLGGTPDWKESLRLALRRLGSLVWLAFLMGGGLGLAYMALVVPGIWLSVAWSLAFAALIAEGTPGTRALRRSFGLVRGRWWPTFGTLLLVFILRMIVEQIVSIPFTVGFWASEPGSLGAFVTLAAASIASAVITTPFVAAVFVLIYFDLRVRKEGFDLELLARAMGPPPAGSAGSGSGWPPPAGPAGSAGSGSGWPPPAGPAGPAGPPAGGGAGGWPSSPSPS